jgi:hypothetical protein
MSKKQEVQIVSLRGWGALLVVDEDDHLTVHINNRDGTQVHDVDVDLGTEGGELARLFTTDGIEDAYSKTTKEGA